MINNIIFAGTPAFSAVILNTLIELNFSIKAVYTQPDRPTGRGQKIVFSPVKELAMKHHLPVYQPHTLKDVNEQARLASLNADMMIVVAYGLLLPTPVLQAPRLGCINVHASLLPRWRGAAPIQRSILAGDKKTGITIMQMEEGLDTGPMLYTMECPIEMHDTTQILHDRLSLLGAEALLNALNQWSSLEPKVQDNDLATYAHKIAKEESFLDWNLSAEELDRKIRAFNPWPVAQTSMGDLTVRIWEARVANEISHAMPGEIIKVMRDGIYVATREDITTQENIATQKNVLQITEMQLPGGKRLPVADILNARQMEFSVGKKFLVTKNKI